MRGVSISICITITIVMSITSISMMLAIVILVIATVATFTVVFIILVVIHHRLIIILISFWSCSYCPYNYHEAGPCLLKALLSAAASDRLSNTRPLSEMPPPSAACDQRPKPGIWNPEGHNSFQTGAALPEEEECPPVAIENCRRRFVSRATSAPGFALP